MQTFRRLTALLLTLLAWTTQAQVVTTSPVFFTDQTAVTITYDATQGNGALANFTGNVYIWTGTVTNLSTSNVNWRNVHSPTFGAADPTALMTRDATNPNIYRITFTPRTYYPIPAAETLLRLGMIFKNADGSVVGRASGGGDIFVDAYQGGAAVRITSPAHAANPQFVAPNVAIPVTGESAQAANLTLTLNGTTVATATNATTISGNATPTQSGRNVLKLTAGTGSSAVSDSVILVVRPTVTVAALPAGAKEGVTYLPGGTSVILALTAPGKQFVYAVGEFNNFQTTNAGFMNKTPDGNMWWVQLNGLTAGQEYAYQYLIDGTLRVADPYTEKVLDPSNDQYIPALTYPNLRAYPSGQTGIMSVLQTNQMPYTWQVANFTRPAKTDLVIYELHIRDFIARHDFQTLRDTLRYIQRLGVNCIELMPVNEFEGNDSWGYNPSFYFAVDKYYGTKNALKAFIDEAHRRGMAVVLDMVLNHSCGQSPMVQMYSDGGEPSLTNPWYNRVATHPFNVCYDFNHESTFTRAFSKNVMDFWVNEFRIDGYRFDLSKGFTQVNSGSNVGLWGNYDQSRINIWNDYNNRIQANRAGTYVILEHFADNSEETVLANAGMMLWGNMNYAYVNTSKGSTSNTNFINGYYGTNGRGWQQPGLVSYMESHDEQRLMYEALTAGLNNGNGYNVQNLATALSRQEMNAAFFFTIPGPKMVWQFGELGYDIDINQNGRTGAKPILWNYLQDANRRRLRDTYANLIALRKQPGFSTATFTGALGGQSKVLHLTDPNLKITAVGNFGIFGDQVDPDFQQTGKWYNYLTGDSITVTNTHTLLDLNPGDFAVYTTRRIRRLTLATRAEQLNVFHLAAAPNPASGTTTLQYELPAAGAAQITVRNVLGQAVLTLPTLRESAGNHTRELPLGKLAAGVYIVQLRSNTQQQTMRLVVE
jgi:glycosidase